MKKDTKKISPSVREELQYKRSEVSLDKITALYRLPRTLGMKKEALIAQDACLSDSFDVIGGSLLAHASELGQYPMTSFIGYGALQQIAQNGMIRACIQTTADEMTREWITLTGGEDAEKVSELGKTIEYKYNLRELCNHAFSVMGYMGGSFIYIDTGTDDPSLPLSLTKESAEFGAGRKLRFVAVDPITVSPLEYNSSEPLRADFMKPRAWMVYGKRVHASRMVTFVDNVPPALLAPAYNCLGIPQAQILWDYVLHWNKARTATIELLEKMNFMIFKTEAMQYLSAPNGLADLDAKVNFMNRYRSNNSIFVCDNEGEDVQNVTSQITGATDIAKQALEFVAAIDRKPAVKLLGISPAGFNATGESDIRNYYDHIASKQEKFRNELMQLIKAVELAEWGETDSSVSFEFNELGKEDEAQKISTSSQLAQMLTALQEHQAISAEEVRAIMRAYKPANLDSLDKEMPEQEQGQSDSPMADEISKILGAGNAESKDAPSD